jgi:hypothetical protein
MVINQEYRIDKEEHNVITSLRRTLPRFIGTVCVALSLEGLIMVIKYSQLDMAGNLYYPVAIIISTALLLAALGVFLKLSPEPIDKNSSANVVTHKSIHTMDKEKVVHPIPVYN